MFELTLDATGSSPRLATLTLDRPGEKVNTISPAALDEMEAILDRLENESVDAVVIRSGKPSSFVVGADVEAFAGAETREEVERFSAHGHRVLARLAAFDRPIVAAIHGPCLGAGLELALVCDGRVCTSSPKTVLGVPEVQLGLFPGAGGATRLPRMVGLRAALDMILTGRNIRPRQAKRMGLVDEIVEPESLAIAARDMAANLAKGGSTRERTRKVMDRALDGTALGRKLVFRQARKSVRAKTQGLYPAPVVALDLIEKGLRLSVDEALKLEPPAFAELAVSDVSRALVGLFQRSNALKRQTADGPQGTAVKAPDIQRLGLLGGGFMGADIAIVAAQAGIETRIREIDGAALGRALGHVDSFFRGRAKKGGARHVYKARHRVSGALDLAGFDTMDLVIEAVPEDLALKRRVFAELEAKAGSHTVLATNTSAIPVSEIGAELKDPSRFVGLHFFSPVPKMPLLEIVRTEKTSSETLAAALAFASAIGKTPVVVRDGPGFYTTRVLGFYLGAAIDLVREGHGIESIDRGAKMVGWPVGPLALLDEVGIDVGIKVQKTLAQYFPDRAAVDERVEAFIGNERLGRKSGRGFYVYPADGKKRPDPGALELFGPRPSAPAMAPEELGERMTMVAAMEAIRCLEEGIIANTVDGDVGAVFGIGYPPLRGGPFWHMDERGADVVLERLGTFEARHGERYAAPQLLRRLAKDGRRFVDHSPESSGDATT